MATLYIFAGLPGSGKTTLASRLASKKGAAFLRIDTIEQGLRDLCDVEVVGEGYRLAYRLAADNLGLGMDVVADSCNPIELTRAEWGQVAVDTGAPHINIEVVCSDEAEHRQRIESRTSTIPGLKLPTWEKVQNRQYDSWETEPIRVDTAGRSIDECLQDLISQLA